MEAFIGRLTTKPKCTTKNDAEEGEKKERKKKKKERKKRMKLRPDYIAPNGKMTTEQRFGRI
jgi:hypothetical protein